MYLVYILFSKTLNRYYVGMTGDLIDERIRRHNSNHIGFSANAKDWELKYSESFISKKLALFREKEIKKMKSRVFIEKLINCS